MYHPYLRGKQFDLLGVRELISPVFENKTSLISPIIEPVRDSSTLYTTLKALAENNINFTLIINPLVGDFVEREPQKIFEIINSNLADYDNFQCGVILDHQLESNSIIGLLRENKNLVKTLSLIHNASFDNISKGLELFADIAPVKFNILNHAFVNSRYRRQFDSNTLVQLNDYFQAQTRNADYLATPETNFSEEHLYYKDEGYIGYADYTTIGDAYSESGFLPYAVAIHLSYADSEKRIKVKHFVSESNDDTSDIGGKFLEALTKAIEWCDANKQDSFAINQLREYHARKHFPGLGVIKKLSMMNHVELVISLIEE